MMENSEFADESYSGAILAKFEKRKPKNTEFVGFKDKKKEFKAQKRKWEEEKAMKKIQKRIDTEQKVKAEEEEKRSVRESLGRDWTLSIALPGSIVDNAQSDELRTYLAGQIARAATVFCVDEVIVYDEMKSISRNDDGEFVNITTKKRRNGSIMLAKILQYLDCPQYLRKSFFPPQPDLKNAGLLNPLDAPHHLRIDSWNDYREGVVRPKNVKDGKGSYVDIGLKKECQIDRHLVGGVRVTVKIDPESKDEKFSKKYKGIAVAPSEPRTEHGQYWGYKTRLVTCLSEVFSQCPYKEGYDLTIGTSEKGDNVDSYTIPKPFKHILVVFGGVKGLEAALEADDKLEASDPRDLFTDYLNTCPVQGSGTIRTENTEFVGFKDKKKEFKAQKRKWEEEKAMKKIQKRIDTEQKVKAEEEEKRSVRESLGRDWTLSIALPGSIVDNAQSDELRTYLAGQIARAATVFCVDEVIVYDEMKSISRNDDGEFVNITTKKRRNGSIMLAKILQYLDCPQYLLKSFFPPQPDLKNAGLLNPLDAPHHLRIDSWNDYREGVVRPKNVKDGKGSYVDIGLKKECQIDRHLVGGVRVTVKIDPESKDEKFSKKYKGIAVAPSEPRTEHGQYWGYKTRLVTCLSEVFSQCPYKEGYDLTIGTSEKGDNVDSYTIPKPFKHILVVFGGVKGLEAALEADDKLEASDPRDLFTDYLNTCPVQGSGTIRTEEALLISLSALRPKMVKIQTKIKPEAS